MMLEGGSCMTILILGVLFITEWELGKCLGVHEPTFKFARFLLAASFACGHVQWIYTHVIFCGGVDGDGHLFRECPFPPLVEIRENPEFHDLMRIDNFLAAVLAMAWLVAYAVWC